MHIRKSLALPAALLSVAAVGVGAAPASASASVAHAKAPKAQSITIVIKDVTTPDGSTGPAFIGPGGTGAKSLFTAHVGKPVVLNVVNRSTTMHSFTAKAVGLNTMILVGAKATIKFTPKKAGAVTWVCIPPCGTWVMDNDGYMKGTFTVTK